MVKSLAKPKVKARDRGNAAWCVRKHCGGAFRHATETNQKLGRNINNKTGKIKLDRPTQDEANAIIYDLDQIEYHIQSEVLPQLTKKTTRRQLRNIDKRARKIRQNISQTGVIFYDNKTVDEDAMVVMEKSAGDLKALVADIDKAASTIMKQEQIECEKCVEDLVGLDGLQNIKANTKPVALKKTSRKLIKIPELKIPKLFGKKELTPAEKAWVTRKKKYGSNGRK